MPVIAAGALVAGTGSALAAAVEGAVMQQQVPAAALARVSSCQTLGTYSVGPLGLVAAGPAAAAVGTGAVLWFAAVCATVAGLVVLTRPGIRAVTWPPAPGTSGRP
ncbi:hypothetical protein GXW82_15230 [Streptacidiphilus sp. 4-A2]|nr:hypothetical protein [Streptacidiphilus sp. 4-A2]